MVLPAGISFDHWERLGRTLAELAGSTQWLMGDWLAYGEDHLKGEEGYKRVEHGLYTKMAQLTGLSEQRLRNAKWICTAVNLSRRRDKLTPAHAEEIVGRSTAGQFDFWIDRVQKEDLSVKHLREQLRKSTAVHKTEPNDSGKVTPLVVTDQYVRDMMAFDPDKFTPAQKREHLKNLEPVLRALAP